MADLKARPSRGYSLIDTLPSYLVDEPVGNSLRKALAAAVETLKPYAAHATLSDANFAGRYALNVLTRENWFEREDGNLKYRSPPYEAAHFAALQSEGVNGGAKACQRGGAKVGQFGACALGRDALK